MFEFIKRNWNKWGERGMRLPFIYDAPSEKPSLTVMFPYVTFIIASASVVALHFYSSLIIATTTAIFFWLIATVLYMLRKLQKASFDLKEQTFSLEGLEHPKKDQNEQNNTISTKL